MGIKAPFAVQEVCITVTRHVKDRQVAAVNALNGRGFLDLIRPASSTTQMEILHPGGCGGGASLLVRSVSGLSPVRGARGEIVAADVAVERAFIGVR